MTPELTDKELAEIETRAAAATDGPWKTRWAGQQFYVFGPNDDETEYIAEWTYAVRTWEPEAAADRAECLVADALFIAAARTDVPRLVAALRAAREDVAVHHADEAGVLQAALGDRFSPDGPLADAVGLLVEQHDRVLDALAAAHEETTADLRAALARAEKATADLRALCVLDEGAAYMRLVDDEPIDEHGSYVLDPALAVAVADVLRILDRASLAADVPAAPDAPQKCDCPAAYSWGATGRMPEGHMIAKVGSREYLAHVPAPAVLPAAPDSPATADHETHPAGEEKP